MTSIPDHYAALGIDPTADPEVITAAYRALAKKFHPDTGAAGGTASPERFDEVQKAYEVLRTPESRHAYDLELLEATEAELAAHLAAKRRVALREEPAGAAPPPPDLGDIRPEPATRPTVPPLRGSARPPGGNAKPPRSRLPIVVPLMLMLGLGGGAAWLLLPRSPAAPPLPGAAQQAGKSDQPKLAAAKPEPPPAAAAAAPAAATPAAPASAAPSALPADSTADDGQPVFGSTVTDSAEATMDEASADAVPVPDAGSDMPNSAAADGKADKPVFGSSGALLAPAAPAAAPAVATPQPAPLPKPKPAAPVRQAAQPQKPPAQAKPAAPPKQAYAPPRARLQFQDPPQYTPQPDGYAQADDGYPQPDDYPPQDAGPPGYAPPGYAPPGYAPPGYDQPGFPPRAMPGMGPYRLVIFERQPGQQATAWSAGVVFNSMGKCTKVGVKTVLRRTSAMDPYSNGVRVWYECQQLSQR